MGEDMEARHALVMEVSGTLLKAATEITEQQRVTIDGLRAALSEALDAYDAAADTACCESGPCEHRARMIELRKRHLEPKETT